MLKSSSRFFFPTWEYDDDDDDDEENDDDEKEKKNGKQGGKTQNFFCDEDAKRHNALLAIDIQRLSDESFNTKKKKKKKKKKKMKSQKQEKKKKRGQEDGFLKDDEDGAYTVTVESAEGDARDVTVTVTTSSEQRGNETLLGSHWIAAYSPARADVKAIAPIKYAILNAVSKGRYVETGAVEVMFKLTSVREETYDFVLLEILGCGNITTARKFWQGARR